jgi:hypothetical protein
MTSLVASPDQNPRQFASELGQMKLDHQARVFGLGYGLHHGLSIHRGRLERGSDVQEPWPRANDYDVTDFK